MVTEGPVVGMSGATAPYSYRDCAAMGTGFWCQYIRIRPPGKVLEAGDEVADGAVAVSPAD